MNNKIALLFAFIVSNNFLLFSEPFVCPNCGLELKITRLSDVVYKQAMLKESNARKLNDYVIEASPKGFMPNKAENNLLFINKTKVVIYLPQKIESQICKNLALKSSEFADLLPQEKHALIRHHFSELITKQGFSMIFSKKSIPFATQFKRSAAEKSKLIQELVIKNWQLIAIAVGASVLTTLVTCKVISSQSNDVSEELARRAPEAANALPNRGPLVLGDNQQLQQPMPVVKIAALRPLNNSARQPKISIPPPIPPKPKTFAQQPSFNLQKAIIRELEKRRGAPVPPPMPQSPPKSKRIQSIHLQNAIKQEVTQRVERAQRRANEERARQLEEARIRKGIHNNAIKAFNGIIKELGKSIPKTVLIKPAFKLFIKTRNEDPCNFGDEFWNGKINKLRVAIRQSRAFTADATRKLSPSKESAASSARRISAERDRRAHPEKLIAHERESIQASQQIDQLFERLNQSLGDLENFKNTMLEILNTRPGYKKHEES
ncbi:hypothetical protein KAW80_03310 [Candidatus Babeliales bacterium]|nr:hypothetical protein [Candidatus Babeliales bacterium]